MFLQYIEGRLESNTYSVLDDDAVAHAVVAYPIDGKGFARTVCLAWRQMRVHSQLAKLKHLKWQPVTCLFCLTEAYVVDAPSFHNTGRLRFG